MRRCDKLNFNDFILKTLTLTLITGITDRCYYGYMFLKKNIFRLSDTIGKYSNTVLPVFKSMKSFCAFFLFLFISITVSADICELIKDINTTSTESVKYITKAGDVVYFQANDNIHGVELWKSDGTESGTVMVKDIYSGPNGSAPSSFCNVNGVLFFTADDGVRGRALWKSDGTETGRA